MSQALEALQYANAARIRYARLKRDVKERRLSIERALEDPRGKGNLTIYALLLAMPHYGPQRVDRFLARLDIDPAMRVDQLTLIQRRYIAEEEERRGKVAAAHLASKRRRQARRAQTFA